MVFDKAYGAAKGPKTKAQNLSAWALSLKIPRLQHTSDQRFNVIPDIFKVLNSN